MSDIVTRLDSATVSFKIEGDLVWDGVGTAFANADAGQQVEFLLGLETAMTRLGPLAAGIQLAYIADAVPNAETAAVLARRFELLAAHLRDRAEVSDS